MCDDGATRQFTKELLLNELSSRVGTSIAIEFWEIAKVIAVADGTYNVIYCENCGGYMGNEELFPGHKLRALQNVMQATEALVDTLIRIFWI